jgi:hypothetical protein
MILTKANHKRRRKKKRATKCRNKNEGRFSMLKG